MTSLKRLGRDPSERLDPNENDELDDAEADERYDRWPQWEGNRLLWAMGACVVITVVAALIQQC